MNLLEKFQQGSIYCRWLFILEEDPGNGLVGMHRTANAHFLEYPHVHNLSNAFAVIGIDIGKNSFAPFRKRGDFSPIWYPPRPVLISLRAYVTFIKFGCEFVSHFAFPPGMAMGWHRYPIRCCAV